MRIRRSDAGAIDAAQAKAQLALMLAGARTLDHFTVELLARIHRLPAREIECALAAARQKRAANG